MAQFPTIKKHTIDNIVRDTTSLRVSRGSASVARDIAANFLFQVLNKSKREAMRRAKTSSGLVLKKVDVKEAAKQLPMGYRRGTSAHTKALLKYFNQFEILNATETQLRSVDEDAIEKLMELTAAYVEYITEQADQYARHSGRVTIQLEDYYRVLGISLPKKSNF